MRATCAGRGLPGRAVAVICVALAWSSAIEAGQAGEPETYWSPAQTHAFLAELEARHGGDQSLVAMFDQEKHLQALRKPLSAQGYIGFAPPRRLRFEIVRPFQSVLIYNAGNIARFEREEGEWKTLDTHAARVMVLVMGEISQWMQGKFEAQSNVFDILAAPAPEQRATLILRPKQARFREYIERIDLTIGVPPDRRVERITVREPGGDYTEIRFTTEKRGLHLPPDLFVSPEASIGEALPSGDRKP